VLAPGMVTPGDRFSLPVIARRQVM